nr:type II toxin-antitoxin system RelE/ParE family toxin [Luteimonas sp. BDR2-5]
MNWSAEALAWLEDIHGHIAVDNPAAAIKVVDGIVQRAEQLQQFPDMGSRLRAEAEGEIRMLLYGHYRIAYLHAVDDDTLHILGVFHGALDIDRYVP